MREKVFAAVIFFITVLLCVLMPKIRLSLGQKTVFTQEFAVGVVQEILEEDLTEDPIISGRYRGVQKLSVKISDGSKKGRVYETYNTLSALHNTKAYKGLKAVFTIRLQDGKESIWLYNQKRDIHVYILALIFCLSIILLGKKQGLKSVLGLAFTCTVIVSILIPALFVGFSPIPISILIVSIVSFVSFILIGGFSRKTYSAILGTICGISIAGLISVIVSYTANLSGVNMEGGEQLLNIAPDYNLKLDGLLFTSILIATLGAVMDVSMSVSSSMHEILNIDPAIEKKKLFQSGLNVGRDITGTMSNTLILAFTGASLPLIMMIWGYGMSLRQFMNIPKIVIHIVQGLAGSMGIIASVPCTAFFSSILPHKSGAFIKSEA